MLLSDKRIVITGGTGSLGKAIVLRLLGGSAGVPHSIVVFSRDETKQHEMRLSHLRAMAATDEVIYGRDRLRFVIGDLRDFDAVCDVLRQADIVINAAALKQVPTCEYYPVEAVATNVLGPANIVAAIRQHRLPVEVVVGVSSDKAVKPVNAYGATKVLQEKLLAAANLDCPTKTRFVCMRYGNVLGSRGSVVPLFCDQIRRGGPVTITDPAMTRFVMDLDRAVDTVLETIRRGAPGETWVPIAPSATVADLAAVMIGDLPVNTEIIGIRPGEKLHEVLISEEELQRTRREGDYYVVAPLLPELREPDLASPALAREYSSADSVLPPADVCRLLHEKGFLPCTS